MAGEGEPVMMHACACACACACVRACVYVCECVLYVCLRGVCMCACACARAGPMRDLRRKAQRDLLALCLLSQESGVRRRNPVHSKAEA